VFIKQGGCFDTLPRGFLVVAPEFVNGSFELPDVGPIDCGPPPVIVGGTPTGWNTDHEDGLVRDHNAPPPTFTCPNPEDGGHFGSMSSGSGGLLRAWQTVAVIPGTYKFSGWFGGNVTGGGSVQIRLLDGDENGTDLATPVTVIDSATVPGNDADAWIYGEISAIAPASGIVTVMWQGDVDAPGCVHADGLTFVSACNDPFADVHPAPDGDGDVDQDDFAAWQLCYTGDTFAGTLPGECECFDRNGNGKIETNDWIAFEACASGPAVAADTSCDGGS
jgi:hypothetical protein